MKFSKKLVFSAFSCAFALGASAQESNDCYVYKSDVITYSDFGLKNIQEFEKNALIYSINYHLRCYFDFSWPSFCFDASLKNCGLVTLTTKGIIKNVALNWYSLQTNREPHIELFLSKHPYRSVDDLYAEETQESYYAGSMTKADNSYDTDDEYYYWGIRDNGTTSYVSSINVTWQLAHIRENLTVGNLGTICLPYDVKAEDWADELTAYTIAGKVMNSTREQVEALVFEEVDEMKAGVAYLFVPKKSGICLKYYGTEVQQPVESQYGLIGSFENYTFTENDCRDNNLFLISNNSIRLAGAGAGVGANRAYIKMSKEMPEYHETNSSRKLLVSANGYIETGDSPTIVEMLKAIASLKDGQNQTSTAYDLQGRMVSGTSAKGIVIENGKKKYISVR